MLPCRGEASGSSGELDKAEIGDDGASKPGVMVLP